MARPVRVIDCESSTRRASPKSRILARPRAAARARKRFAGLMSRWTTRLLRRDGEPLRRRAARAPATSTDGQGAGLQPLLEGAALEPLHGEVAVARRRPTVGDVANDARVRELGEQRGLALEAAVLARARRVQHLDGDRAAIERVAGLIDDAEPTFAYLAQQLEAVPADSRHARTGWGRWPRRRNVCPGR